MSSTIGLSDHIAIRLTDFRADGITRLEAAFQAIMRRQNAAGMIASGNTIHELECSISEMYRDASNIGASFICEASEYEFDKYLDLLNTFSITLQLDVLHAYESVFPHLGLRGNNLTFQDRAEIVRSKLETIRDRLIGDFKIGMVGGKRVTGAKNHNSVSFKGAVINAPISVAQSISSSEPDRDVLKFLGELLKSDHLAHLPNEAKDAANAAHEELNKPAPNKPAVVKYLETLAEYASRAGMISLANTVIEVAKNYVANL